MVTENIVVKQAILHVLDSEHGKMILSSQCLSLGSLMAEFIKNHISRLVRNDSVKKCYFKEQNSETRVLSTKIDPDIFVQSSQELAKRLYSIMYSNAEAIPPADLLMCLFAESGVSYLAILKLDYRKFFTHNTVLDEDGEVNELVLSSSLLPSSSIKLSEAAIIPYDSKYALILEKRHNIIGMRQFYFSEQFLECYSFKSTAEQINMVTKTLEEINRKYHAADCAVQNMETKKRLHEALEDEGILDIQKVAEDIFDSGESAMAKEEFVEKMERFKLDKRVISPAENKSFNRFATQRVKTDNGIIIEIPMDTYKDKACVEFVTNQDGTVSILLKDLRIVESRL